MKKLASVFLVFMISALCAFSQETEIVVSNLENEITNLSEQIKNSGIDNKADLLSRVAKLQEYANMFPEAEESYSECADLSQSDSRTKFLLDAARCSLSYGNSERADSILAKAATEARKNDFAPLFKLYAVWSWFIKCNSYEETYEPVAILKSYLELDQMYSVRHKVLFTLWFITNQEQYSKMLETEFPLSAEYAVISGKAELAPSPFWYFTCRKVNEKNFQ